MARIVLADDGIEFDGLTPDEHPLGGVETSIVALTQELASRGHEVHVMNNCKNSIDCHGVSWRSIETEPWPNAVDLYIANRGDKLLCRMPKARRTVFWIHNPASYLMKWRYLSKLWRLKPAIIFIGDYHATTYPTWAPAGERVVIPYGLSNIFCEANELNAPPAPRAAFTSNPLRSLDWLLDLWGTGIRPRVPKAELHVFAGAATYGHVGAAKAEKMDLVLNRAKSMEGVGVRLRGPVPKKKLVQELQASRVMLYRGDLNETFCLAIGEAQAMGVPAVVGNLGSVNERVLDNRTGFIVEDKETFIDNSIKLLTDDKLWRAQHLEALKMQRSWRWSNAASAFEALLV
jgi:glycosyltransferase involved in cell wall biosynthesis